MSETFLHGVQLLEVDTGSRPIRTVRSSVIGLVGSGSSDAVQASKEIGTGNGKLKFTAVPDGIADGIAGNDYQIFTANPGTNNATLTLTLTGKVITISLATDSSGVATTTAAQVITAWNLATFNNIVNIGLGSGSSGASLYAAHAAQNLVGGVTATFPLNTPVLITSASGIDEKVGANSYLAKALKAIYTQAGAVVVVVRCNNTHDDSDATELTGIYALKRSQAALGYVPRIVVVEQGNAAITDVNAVCDSLKATAFVGLVGLDSATAATSFAASEGNDRTMMIWPTINGGEDPAPFAAGLLAKSDNDRGFWWSPSNQEVFGIESLDAPVDFQLGDPTSLANVLNEGKVTTFIRQGGFRLWGNLTGSIDARYQFLSVRRTADIINDSILAAHLWAVDRNITKTYLQDVAGSVNDYLKTLVNLGAILGGTCWPDPDLNSPDQIALGKVYFNFDFTPPYPAQTVTFRSILTNSYLSELV